MYYLVLILFVVAWILVFIIFNYVATKSAISHKYLNHGKKVPIQKCFKFKFNSVIENSPNYICFYSTSSYLDVNIIKYYEDAYSMKKLIIKDNKNKSGIYKWTNKLTNDVYIGQSVDLANRFIRYFNLSYLKNRETLVISRALIKYGYSNFTLEILEYCNIADLTEREQYYIDKFNPKYNTLKIAGSSSGYKQTEETKIKISKSLKGVYDKEKSGLFSHTPTEETKVKMALKKKTENNPLFGKTHSEETRELMRQKALGRRHSEETLLKMSSSRGHLVYIYEKCDTEGFKLIGSFISIRKAAIYLNIGHSTINSYIKNGGVFKNKYKFSYATLTKGVVNPSK